MSHVETNGSHSQAAPYGTVIVVYPDGREDAVNLRRPANRLGSSVDNEIVIRAAGVEPYHASLLYGLHGFEVLDFGAGILLDGVKIPANEPQQAADDAVLQIGSVRVFLYPPAEQAYAAPPLLGTLAIRDQTGVHTLPVHTPRLRAGSAADNDLLLDQAPAYVAELRLLDSGAELFDLASQQRTPLHGWTRLGSLQVALFHPTDLEGLRLALATPPPLELDDPTPQPEPTSNQPEAVLEPQVTPSAPTPPSAPATVVLEPEPSDDESHAERLDAFFLDPEARAEEELDEALDQAAALALTPVEEVPPPILSRTEPRFGTLVAVFPDKQRRAAELQRPTIRVGRAPDNDIVIDHPAMTDHHFQLFCDPPMYQVLDLATPQGTFVDEARTTGYVPFTLSADSVIGVGALRLFVYPPDVQLDPMPGLAMGRVQPLNLTTTAPVQPEAPEQRTDVRLSPVYSRVTPGQSIALTIALTNHTRVLDHLHVAVEGLDPAWIQLSSTTLPLFPGTRDELTLTLSPPRESASLTGRYPFKITVRSEHQPEYALYAHGTLQILPFTELAATIFPPRQSAQRAAVFEAEITNRSNRRQMVTLRCFDPQGVFKEPFVDRLIWLEPGQTYEFPLRIQVRTGMWLRGRRGSYPFTLNVQSDDQQMVEAHGEFVLLPSLRQLPAPQPTPTRPPALPPPSQPIKAPPAAMISPRVQPRPIVAAPVETIKLPVQPAAVPDEPRPDEFEPAFVTLTPSLLPVDAGGAVTATVAVVNRANIVDRITLAIEGLPKTWVTVTPDSLSMLPNARSEAQIIISPPRVPQSSAGQMRFRLVARSEKRPDKPSVLAGVLDVRPYSEWRQSLLPMERSGYRSGTFTLEVVNRSNHSQQFAFAAQDNEAAAQFVFQPPRLTIPAGESQRVSVNARAGKINWIGQAKLLPFTITTTPEQHEELAQQAPGRLMQKVIIPAWLMQIALPFFLLVLALVLMFGRDAVRQRVSQLFGGGSKATATAQPVANPSDTPAVSAPTEAGEPVRLGGENRWTPTDSPVLLQTTHIISPDSVLIIEPGVDVQFAAGASLEVQGTLIAEGEPGVPITFAAVNNDAIWGNIASLNGGSVSIAEARIHDGGMNGSVVFAQSGALSLRDVAIERNIGGILTYNSTVTLESVQLQNNRFDARPSIGVQLLRGNILTLDDVRIEDNTVASTAASLHILIEQIETNFDIRNTLIRQSGKIAILIQAREPYQGQIECTTLESHTQGVVEQRSSQEAAQLTITQSSLLDATPIALTTNAQLENNWWAQNEPASASNALSQPPSCAP